MSNPKSLLHDAFQEAFQRAHTLDQQGENFLPESTEPLAGFVARQNAWSRNRRATMTVVNKETGINSIVTDEESTLTLTMKNTSGGDMKINEGGSLLIGMPKYFKSEEVDNMIVNATGWDFSIDDGKLKLSAQQNTAWPKGSDLSFDIEQVETAATPFAGMQSRMGAVTLTTDATSIDPTIIKVADLEVVWGNYDAVIDWNAYADGTTFTLDGESSGSTTGSAQAGNDIITLTTATDSNGNTWILGYIFNYNTTDNTVPQVKAVWYKDGARKGKNTYFEGLAVSTSGGQSIAYYSNVVGNPNHLTIDVTFKSTKTQQATPSKLLADA